jgi:hypothetical protein
MEFLPKMAQLENPMTTTAMPKPSLHDFIKTAMEASAAKVDLSLEGARQVANNGDVAPEAEKTASVQQAPAEVPTEYVEKLAGALDYVAQSLNPKVAAAETASDGPGKGPNSLETNQGKLPTEDNIDADQTGEATQKPPMSPGTQKLPGQKGDPGGTMETNESMSHPEQPVEPISNEKTTVKAAEVAYINNLVSLGMLKVAADEKGQAVLVPANDMVKEALGQDTGSYLGSTAGGAAAGGAGGALKGGAMGALGGGLLGAGVGGLGGLMAGGAGAGLAGALGGGAVGAGLGGLGGAAVGGTSGAVGGGVKGYQRARAGGEALAAQQAAAQQAAAQQQPKVAEAKEAEIDPKVLARNFMQLGLFKAAEDALNPASVSAGKADATGATPPAGAAPAGEGVPSEPSDVSSQKKKMISSNEAAINYTKADAKADPKSDMGDVLKEPALTKKTDKVLDKVLEHDGGAKISSITRVASARAILAKLAEEMKDTKDGKKKEKESQGMAPSTPSEASGFSASSTM